MANTFTTFKPTVVHASAGKPDPNTKKSGSPNWWAPLFGWSTYPDYMTNGRISSSEKYDENIKMLDPIQPRSRFGPGCFTEDKARQLRKKTVETSTFHDIMYHSAIASRLASDLPQGYHNK